MISVKINIDDMTTKEKIDLVTRLVNIMEVVEIATALKAGMYEDDLQSLINFNFETIGAPEYS